MPLPIVTPHHDGIQLPVGFDTETITTAGHRQVVALGHQARNLADTLYEQQNARPRKTTPAPALVQAARRFQEAVSELRANAVAYNAVPFHQTLNPALETTLRGCGPLASALTTWCLGAYGQTPKQLSDSLVTDAQFPAKARTSVVALQQGVTRAYASLVGIHAKSEGSSGNLAASSDALAAALDRYLTRRGEPGLSSLAELDEAHATHDKTKGPDTPFAIPLPKTGAWLGVAYGAWSETQNGTAGTDRVI